MDESATLSNQISNQNPQHDVHAIARLAVRAEEVKLLYLQAVSSLAGAVIVALVISVPLYGVLNHAFLAIWFSLLMLVAAARYTLVRRYLGMQHAHEDAYRWEKYFIIGAAISGAVWGALGMFVVLRADFSYQAFVGMALAGVSAGATSSLSSRRMAYQAFLLPTLLPFGAALLTTGGTFQTSMGVLVMLFTWLLITMSKRIYRTISEALALRYQNDALLIEHDKAKHSAEVANRSKSAFLANMSHEIRTPLTAIIGFTETIMDGKQDAAAVADAGKTILRNSRLLLEIINDILDMSKIEADKINIERIPYSPIQVAIDVENAIGLLAREKGLDFKLDYLFPIPETVVGDPTRLKQILLNLSSNAIKFTESGSVTLEVRCDGELLKMAVIDTGIGISEKQIGKLFSPFIQADNTTTRRFGGSGLGLYISRRLAQMMGGDVTVTSTLGVGSRFEVGIATGALDGIKLLASIDQFHQTPVNNDVLTIPSLKGHVLLAEDGIDNQRLVAALLAKTGAEITMVEDGKKAVEHAMAGDYALVLMDMQMPVMGGLEATRMLRQVGFMRPIVAFTANVMKEEIDEYSVAGCNGYLSKPIDRIKFYQTLAEHLPKATDAVKKHGAEDFFSSPQFKALVALFVKGLPGNVEKMDQAMESNELETLRLIAHTLKGSAASFGYPQITEAAAKLEKAIKQGRGEAVAPGLVELKGVIAGVVR